MKRRTVGATIAAGLAVGVVAAHANEATQFDPTAGILTPACDSTDDEGLSVASQKLYWQSAEDRVKAADSSGLGGKNRADRWFFDRITLEAGYTLNGSIRITDYPDNWTRDDKPYGGVKYVLPFSAFREKGQEAARSKAKAEEREWERAKRQAAFYASFVQFKTDLAPSGKRADAAKRALEIGASSKRFAEACLNPMLVESK